jgi:hypothetical protein
MSSVSVAGLVAQLAQQLEALAFVVGRGPRAAVEVRTKEGQWSARDNLAHLARVQDIFFGRLDRILAEDRPRLARYRAEEDADWPGWQGLATGDAIESLRSGRERLIARLEALTPNELLRTGVHPAFGEMTIPEWFHFLLVHEGHHLYVALRRIAEARQAGS